MTETRNVLIIPAGKRAADYLDERISPVEVRKAGYEFVARYLRNLSPTEVTAIQSAGLGLLAIGQYKSSAITDPYERGSNDGLMSNYDAARVGYPTTEPIVRSVDRDVTKTNLPAALEYLRGFNDACVHPQALYGDWDIIDAAGMNSQINWQAAATGWSTDWTTMKWRGIHPMTHIRQYVQQPFGPALLDPNDVIRQVTVWAGRRPGVRA